MPSDEWIKTLADGRRVKFTYQELLDEGAFITGRKMSLPFCEICHFDKQGRIVSGGCYYDQYTLLTQLGHIQPLASAA